MSPTSGNSIPAAEKPMTRESGEFDTVRGGGRVRRRSMAHRVLHRGAAVAAVVVASVLLTPGVGSSQCSSDAGVVGTPSELWGALQPTDTDAVPAARDTTDYDGTQKPNSSYPLFSSLDVETSSQGTYIFTSYSYGLHVWDATGTTRSADPQLVATRDQGAGHFLDQEGGENRWLLWDVDAPPGVTSLVAMTGNTPFGIAIWDTSAPSAPEILYQDTGRHGSQVYTFTRGNRHYAATATSGGVHLYDLSAARARWAGTSGCAEDTTESDDCGVYLGGIGSGIAAEYIDGFTIPDPNSASGSRTFIAYSTTGTGSGVALWEVTDPSDPHDVLSGERLFSDEVILGVALWQQGGQSYLAVQSGGTEGRIHDIDVCLDNGCAAPTEIWSERWPVGVDFQARFVTFSKAGGTPYLHFGTLHACLDIPQGEWIYDLSKLTTDGPQELTPDQTIVVDGVEIGYWGWYYSGNPTGYSKITPRMGKFHGDHLYRAAWTLFDVHRRVDVGPTIDITGPTEAYAGFSVSLSATASNCSQETGDWSWSVDGGTIESGQGTSQIDVTWSTVGSKTVTATRSGCSDATGTHEITVLDPNPSVQSVTADPSPALQCQNITFTAHDVAGKPPLSYEWVVTDDIGGTVAGPTAADDTFEWATGAGTAAGTYTGTVTVTNDDTNGEATASVDVDVQELPQLDLTGDPDVEVSFGTASFDIEGKDQGATRWIWDFGDQINDCAVLTGSWSETGDGRCESTDPDIGPKPVYTYSNTGDYLAEVEIRNCLGDSELSNKVTVEIVEIAPLEIKSFEDPTACGGATCLADTGQQLDFSIETSGDPTSWDIDWGDGSSSSGSGTPPSTVSKTYDVAGTYSATLTIHRGGESVSATVTVEVSDTSDPDPPPPPPDDDEVSISVSGPATGAVDEELSFEASATGCTPSSSGWDWSVDGGDIVGSALGSSINVSWNTAGTRTVAASNLACGSTSGSTSVVIGGGDTPTTSIEVTGPSTGNADEPLSFDATAEGCEADPLGWSWNVDGGTIVEGGIDSSVIVVWESGGTKTVEASNLACGEISGTREITLEDLALCQKDASTLCLREQGRFNIRVDWATSEKTGAATAVDIGKGDSGLFWFFYPDNVEMLVKVLKGCELSDHWWVFAAATTNQEFTLEIEDRQTGYVKRYQNPLGQVPAPIQDLHAIPCGDAEPETVVESVPEADRLESVDIASTPPNGEVDVCTPGEETLCLRRDDRFRVSVDWEKENGAAGAGTTVPLALHDSGLFNFFDENNIELSLKVLNGCDTQLDSYWVFYAAATNVGFDLLVEDTQTGATRTYSNPVGRAAPPVLDVAAFPCD